MAVYAFYSAGGFAREIHAGFVHSIGMVDNGERGEVVFIDDAAESQGQVIRGSRVISYEEAKSIPGIKVNVAFADPKLRRKKVEMCAADGLETFSSFAPTSIIGDDVKIGHSAIFAHNSMVTSDAQIGDSFHCNIYAYVSHDCIVGDFVTFAPRASMNGRVKIEDDVYVGTGAIILPGKTDRYLTIGKGAIIGAGAVVTKDVEPGSVMVGAPAKPR
ncbi:NeuD/PglB/VioB family sugar acetyltransferase [Shinella fusca]|uniref:Sugar O-acyltransferase (Sialic acid O-acetyltransferase NeuD family) n=1 Tax=Shinella fusca TaxID=544480 RepID=A0A7W7YR31_9HYPH|nr:NeuD/PglB/VioB family sugar acetyltransferase [Shinella fusca]MBB5040796.1 sugar O-acyltransferase (sialic acid O-acetyltransferase NeuD family) [Shinella fusca]